MDAGIATFSKDLILEERLDLGTDLTFGSFCLFLSSMQRKLSDLTRKFVHEVVIQKAVSFGKPR